MTAHRYWRLNAVTSVQGTAIALLNIQLRTTIGGANIATGGTASASSTYSGTSAANAFANTGVWSNDNGGLPPNWIAYDLGSGNSADVIEVYIQARNDGSNWQQCPVEFAVQYSDDGSTWVEAWYCTYYDSSGNTRWSSGSTFAFDKPTAGPGGSHSYWGVNNYAETGASWFVISEIQNRGTVGGSTQNVGGTAFVTPQQVGGGNAAANAFDGNLSTKWASNDKRGGQGLLLSYAFLTPVATAQLYMANSNGGDSSQAPSDFGVYYSDDGNNWLQAWAESGVSWPGGSTQISQTWTNPNFSSEETGNVTMSFGGIVMVVDESKTVSPGVTLNLDGVAMSVGGDAAKGGNVTLTLEGIAMAVDAFKSQEVGNVTLALDGIAVSAVAYDVSALPEVTQFWTFG